MASSQPRAAAQARTIIDAITEVWITTLIGLLAILAGDGPTDTRSLFARAPEPDQRKAKP